MSDIDYQYREFISNLIKERGQTFCLFHLRNKKNAHILAEIEKFQYPKLAEKLFYYLGKLRTVCACGEDTRFLPDKMCYAPRCRKCGYSAAAAKIKETLSIVGIDGKTPRQKSAVKANVTKSTTLDADGKNIFQVIGAKSKLIKSVIDTDGKTTFQRAIDKANATKYSVVNSDGLNIHQIGHLKGRNTKLNDIDSDGLNTYQRTIIKINAIKSSTLDINGRNTHQLGAIKTHNTLSIIGPDGLTGHQRMAASAIKTKQLDVDINGDNGLIRAARSTVNTRYLRIDVDGNNSWQQAGKKIAKTLRLKYSTLIGDDLVAPTRSAFLYVIHDKLHDLIKIGWSIDTSKRLIQITKSFNLLSIYVDLHHIVIIEGNFTHIIRMESELHRVFDSFNVVREHGTQGRTEWFREECLQDVLTHINNLPKDKFMIL